MKDIRGKKKGVFVIKENTQYHQLNASDVMVEQNITARVFGVIHNLHLKKGAILYLHGSITGNVINEGGTLNLYGENHT